MKRDVPMHEHAEAEKRRVAAAIASPAAKAVGAAWIAIAFQAIGRLAARSDSDMIAHASDANATGITQIRINGMKGPPSGCGAAASARYGWCRSSSVLLAKKRPHGGGHTRRTRTRECPVLASGSVIFRTEADMKPACGRAHRPPRDTRACTLVVPVKKGPPVTGGPTQITTGGPPAADEFIIA
ncbi:hypothetical protein [Burkholderia anthina]|uniref:hypothetical protein n=1 Tax=Burkholderia anthina TaxID=179879 RepID=UPI0012DAB22F|nr:hypothetical protein [Burkholderia anthina]